MTSARALRERLRYSHVHSASASAVVTFHDFFIFDLLSNTIACIPFNSYFSDGNGHGEEGEGKRGENISMMNRKRAEKLYTQQTAAARSTSFSFTFIQRTRICLTWRSGVI